MDFYQERLDLGLIKPDKDDHRPHRNFTYYSHYDLKHFLANIPKYDLPITKTETVYVETKSISQTKLREAGFKITRSKENATFIIVDNFLSFNEDMTNLGWNLREEVFRFNDRIRAEDFIDNRIVDFLKDYKYIQVKDIYSTLYKYEVTFDLYSNIMQLLKSREVSNVTMAMEFMSNANWEDDKVYLMDIFTNHAETIWHNPYRTSISFKGFTESLGFSFRSVNLKDPNDYRLYCSKEEHHQFVYNKFEEEFKEKFKELVTRFKIKVNEFTYGIDYNTVEEGEEC